MAEEDNDRATDLAERTAYIVSAYVRNNPVPVAGLPDLIATVCESLVGLSTSLPVRPVPAVDPKRSVFPNYIICLEDGQKFKSMKRHLELLGMTPAEYRAKWGLPFDYPISAQSYRTLRSALAKAQGLGRQGWRQRKAAAKAK